MSKRALWVHTDLSPIECMVVTHDPLLFNVPLPYRRTFYPFGFGATIATNCQTVLDAAESVWGRFRKKMRSEPAVELRLAVSGSTATEKPETKMPRAQGHLVSFIHDAENFAICDLRSGFGFGWLTPPVANDLTYVRYHFVEACIYTLLEGLYLTPVHAACVSLHGSGLLLTGESGAGKSSLSYFCARRGWDFICDDGVQLIRESHDRIATGIPYQIRLRPHGMELFPELAGNVPMDRPIGKPSIELETESLGFSVAEQAPVTGLIFLNRTADAIQRLSGYDKEEAFEQLSEVITMGDEPCREAMRATLRRLLDVPVYEIRYHDLDWAEQRLRALVENHE